MSHGPVSGGVMGYGHPSWLLAHPGREFSTEAEVQRFAQCLLAIPTRSRRAKRNTSERNGQNKVVRHDAFKFSWPEESAAANGHGGSFNTHAHSVGSRSVQVLTNVYALMETNPKTIECRSFPVDRKRPPPTTLPTTSRYTFAPPRATLLLRCQQRWLKPAAVMARR